MATKLSPEKIARICARHAAGATYDELAAAFKVSVGTVANALKRGEKRRSAPDVRALKSKPSAPAPAAAPPVDRPPPTADDVRRDLAAQIESLRGELGAAESPALRASLNRILVSAQTLLAKITPTTADGIPEGYVLVRIDELKDEGKRGAETLLKTLQAMFPQGETFPTCPGCQRPIYPSAEELEARIEPTPAPAPALPAQTPTRPGMRETWRDGSHVAGAPIHDNPAMARRRDGI